MTTGAHIRVDQAGNSVATGTYDQVREDLWQLSVQLVGDQSGGQSAPAWTLIDKPPGSTAALGGAGTFAATVSEAPRLTPGTYTVQFLVGDGLAINGNQKFLSFRVTKNAAGTLSYDGGVVLPGYGEDASAGAGSGGQQRGFAPIFDAHLTHKELTVPNVTALLGIVGFRVTKVHLLGYTTSGDGGGGHFYWDASSTAAHDYGTCFQPGFGTGSALATGRWIRQFSGALEARFFGVKTDGTDQSTPLSHALAAVVARGSGELVFGRGTVTYGTQIELPSYVFLAGEGKSATILKYTGTGAGVHCTGKTVAFDSLDNSGLRSMQIWATQGYALELETDATHALAKFRADDCLFKIDGITKAAIHLIGAAGTGGLGYVYWPSFFNCDYEGPLAAGYCAIGASAFRSETGNGSIFVQIVGGSSRFFGLHFDLVVAHGWRVQGLTCDGNATLTADGYFIKFKGAGQNVFEDMHLESSGADKLVDFDTTPGCDGNGVADMAQNDIIGVTGDRGLRGNWTRGFAHHSGSDANVVPWATHFGRLLQDTILPFSGTDITVAGVKCDTGDVTLGAGDGTGCALRTAGSQLRLPCPNGNPAIRVTNSQIIYTHTLHEWYNAAGSVKFFSISDSGGPTKFGFFGAAPAARGAAYTQTYATADRTLSAYTPSAQGSAYTGAADGEAKLADLNALRVAYENLRAFAEDLAQMVNAMLDDDQAVGLKQ